MKQLFNKALDWLKQSNRLKHLLGGVAIGLFADGWYCALYAGIGVGAAMELKDKLWGGKPDWIDLALTAAGAAIGHIPTWLIFGR